MTLDEARADREFRGRLVESGGGRALTAIEVKSGRAGERLPGTEAFAAAFKPTRMLLVGTGGIAIEAFLSKPAEHWIAA